MTPRLTKQLIYRCNGNNLSYVTTALAEDAEDALVKTNASSGRYVVTDPDFTRISAHTVTRRIRVVSD